jgi:hypothetical protein
MLAWLAQSALMMSPVGTIIKWLWSWLSHATFLQVMGVVLGIALLLDHAALLISHRENGKLKGQLHTAIAARDDYKHQLDSISTKRNEQAVQTKTRIVSVIKTIHDADERAKVVEQAAPAKDCKTKPEVLQADL